MSIIVIESNETCQTLGFKTVPEFVKWYKANNYVMTIIKQKGLFANHFSIMIDNPNEIEDSYTVKRIPEAN